MTSKELGPVGSPDALPPLRDVIAALSLSAKKSLGQNFILDLNLTSRIARLATGSGDTTVIEIGPGPGGLTRGLLSEGARRVIAVERDHRCKPALDQIAAAWPGKLEAHYADALEIDWTEILGAEPGPVALAANLPYNIATKLLTGWLSVDPWPPWFQAMVLMFQSEVADRIVAVPGSKAYGRLSVLTQWRCDIDRALNLKPNAFTPPPKVDSSVVVFKPRAPIGEPTTPAALERITAAAFGQRRKMLRASLKALTPFPDLLLSEAQIDGTRRAETVTVTEFVRLAHIWSRETNID